MQSWNKSLLIIMALVLVSVNIYAPAVCWDHIECDRNPLPSGVIMHYDPEIEIACEIIGLTPDLSHEGRIEVEILQPGYNGATLKQNLFINRDFINLSGGSIFFYLGRGMSPTYVNCYDTILKTDGEITRKNSLKHWAISFTKTWYESINPIPKAETWIVDSQNQILNKTGTVFDINSKISVDSNIPIYKNYYIFEDPNYKYPLGILFIILGALLFFATFMNNSIKEFI